MIAFLMWSEAGDRSRAFANEVVEEDELIYDEEEFDQMMLKYKTVEETKQKLSQFLSKEIEVIDKFCALTETQKKKMLVAGRGDIQWYFDYLSEIRGRYVNRPLSQDEYQTLIQESGARRACMSLAVFGEASMLRKVLANALSEQQLALYQKLERERHRTLIDGFVRNLEWKKDLE